MGVFRSWAEAADPTAVVTQYLTQIQQAGYVLLAHQTDPQTALAITKGQDFGMGAGLEGTALYTTPEKMAAVLDRMRRADQATAAGDQAAASDAAVGHVHRGSRAILVMAVPRAAAGRRIGDLDDKLADLAITGKRQSLALPNQYVVGYWAADGQFYANSRFKPQAGPLS